MSSDNRRLTARKSIKMTPSLIELIDSKMTEKWSPEQIYGRLRMRFLFSRFLLFVATKSE
jgi:IS30 family transposase